MHLHQITQITLTSPPGQLNLAEIRATLQEQNLSGIGTISLSLRNEGGMDKIFVRPRPFLEGDNENFTRKVAVAIFEKFQDFEPHFDSLVVPPPKNNTNGNVNIIKMGRHLRGWQP